MSRLLAVDLNAVRTSAIVAAGFGAGFVNSIVGSGTLISFPTLVGVGFPQRIANITNNTGLVPGSWSAVAAQRRELRDQRARLFQLVPASLIGGTVGALALLNLPSTYFKHIVPFLVLFGVSMVILGPRIQQFVKDRNAARDSTRALHRVSPWLQIAVALAGVYGGYFGAAQGVILMGLMGTTIDDSLPRINAVKNVLAGTVNLVAATIFIVHGGVVWSAAALLAFGSTLGGVSGSKVGRRISPAALRAVIVVVGLIAAVKLFRDW